MRLAPAWRPAAWIRLAVMSRSLLLSRSMIAMAAPPNPVASGGVTVCNLTVFMEDIVGTVNVLTGQSTVRAPQRARTYSRTVGSANKPCPVCGGFCGVSKERCASNADCPGSTGPCVTAGSPMRRAMRFWRR